MLPNFGRVLAWMMTPTDVARERPGPPPSTSSAQMAQEVAEVQDTLERLSREQLAIALLWNDGAGTYTPPGHWNDIATEYVRDARMSEVRAARVFALLNMAMHDAAVGCWDTKFAYFNPRPSQLDARIKTSIGLPNFPAYTSGHSTFSSAATAVLSYLFPAGASSFEAMRGEAAISRLYGGIHYRADIETGTASASAAIQWPSRGRTGRTSD
jgi:membrane-associated phospholipid phosphatase